MDVRYTCNLDDYREAQYAQLRRSASYYIMLVGGGLCLLFGAVLALTRTFASAAPILLLALFWLGWVLAYLPLKLKRDFHGHPNFAKDCHVHADDEGLRSESELSSGETKWAAFTKFRETSNLFMLYFGGRMFKVVPKRAFSPSELEQFRALLRRKLSTK